MAIAGALTTLSMEVTQPRQQKSKFLVITTRICLCVAATSCVPDRAGIR
jgi:hypothetical protein